MFFLTCLVAAVTMIMVGAPLWLALDQLVREPSGEAWDMLTDWVQEREQRKAVLQLPYITWSSVSHQSDGE